MAGHSNRGVDYFLSSKIERVGAGEVVRMDARLHNEWLQHRTKELVKREKDLEKMIPKLTYKRDALTAEINMCYEKIHKMAEERCAIRAELQPIPSAVATDPQVPPPAPE